MEESTAEQSPSPFEQVRHEQNGQEYWSARDLATILGYAQWRNFDQAIGRAMRACRNSGQSVADHFAEVSKMVELGSGALRKVKDYQLSRYACYLTIQNADPEKEIVALGQTYFAVQTRRQEVADEEILAGLTEDQRRLYLRGQLADHNKQLSNTARTTGVVTVQDFAIFHDAGYAGLYGGLRAQDIHAKKQLGKRQHILDHMNASELAANLFRATQTDEKLRREGIASKEAANQAHYQVGRIVRRTIGEIGGVMPEDQPTPEKSIKEVAVEEQKRLKRNDQPQLPLFDLGDSDASKNTEK